MELNELKPCPFCGTNGFDMHLCRKFVHDNVRYFITCGWCGASTGLYFEEKHAKEMWNRRANDEKSSYGT